MLRREVTELHYIVSVDNLRSILRRGIYSYNRMETSGLKHVSVANLEVQARRERKVPGTDRTVHDYANLYFNARNAMMFVVKHGTGVESLAVLGVSPDVLDLDDVVISDTNAAVGFTRFRPYPEGLALVDRGVVFAKYWGHDDPIETIRHKQKMCAEVLVPELVEAEYIRRIHVSCRATKEKVASLTELPVEVTPYLFFE